MWIHQGQETGRSGSAKTSNLLCSRECVRGVERIELKEAFLEIEQHVQPILSEVRPEPGPRGGKAVRSCVLPPKVLVVKEIVPATRIEPSKSLQIYGVQRAIEFPVPPSHELVVPLEGLLPNGGIE